MSRLIDRHLPMICIVLGLFTHIVWTVINSVFSEIETHAPRGGDVLSSLRQN
jgi:hypothetical protein